MRSHDEGTQTHPGDAAMPASPHQGQEGAVLPDVGTVARVDPDGTEREATPMPPNQHSDADADFATDAARTYHGGPEQA